MSYRSEAAFYRALAPMLSKVYAKVQRIESGTTGRGVPDVWAHDGKHEVWIEIKNDPYQSVLSVVYDIKWRPGQQAWHLDYYRATGRSVYTIQAMKDGIVIFALDRLHHRNKVAMRDCAVVRTVRDVADTLRARSGV